MEFDEDARLDTSQVEDARGAGGGLGGGAAGPLMALLGSGRLGIVGTIVVLVILLCVGGGTFGSQLLDGGNSAPKPDSGDLSQRCAPGNPNRFNDTDCRNVLFINSIQAYWTQAYPQTFNGAYQKAQTQFFSQAVSTGCGQADSGVGPFYCPADHHIYIDLTFYSELANRFGASGQFAQAYVLAHEYGHHVQNLSGTNAQMRRAQERDPANANQYSVLLELQADCYAGVWSAHAAKTTDAGGEPLFKSLTQQDIAQALQAAAAIGDDAIQKKVSGRVDESKFTHGTSAQRQQWFSKGHDTGDPKACNTFGS